MVYKQLGCIYTYGKIERKEKQGRLLKYTRGRERERARGISYVGVDRSADGVNLIRNMCLHV